MTRARAEQLVLVIALGAFGTMSLALLSPVLPDLAAELGVSRAAIGWVQGAVAFPSIAVSPLLGYLSDRFGRRRVVLTAVVVFTLFGTAGFWARSFSTLVTLRVLQGVATSGMLGMGVALIGDLYEGADRTRALAYNMVGTTLVSIAAPIASGVVAEGGAFRPFLLYVVGVPLGLWATRLRVAGPTAEAQSLLPHAAAALSDLRRRGTARDFGAVLAATLVMVMVLHGVTTTAAPLFVDSEFGTSVSARGLMVAAFQVGVAAAAAIITRLKLAWGTASVFTAGYAAMTLALSAALLAGNVTMVGVALAAVGFGFGLVVPLVQQFATDAATVAYRGIVVLTWVTVVRVAQSIGPPLSSALTDSVAPRAAFVVAAIATGAVAVGWRPLRVALNR